MVPVETHISHLCIEEESVGIIGNLERIHTSVFSLAVFTARPISQSGNTTPRDKQQRLSLATNNKIAYFSSVHSNTSTRSLVDTGAEVSVLPSTFTHKRKPSAFTHQPVNKSTISTFSERSITLTLGLSHVYQWILTCNTSQIYRSSRLLLLLGFLLRFTTISSS